MRKKEDLNLSELFDVIEQLYHYDDRSMVIVGGAFVENSLIELIKNNLRQCKSTESILGNLPFQKKIELADSLGLISEREVKDLICIKDIRNKFAHSMLIKEVDNVQLIEYYKRLTLFKDFNHETIRDLPSMTFMILAFAFFSRNQTKSIDRIELDAYDGFGSLSDNIGQFVSHFSVISEKVGSIVKKIIEVS